MRSVGLLLVFSAAVAAAGEPPPPAAQGEIRHLLATLERSDCRFSRNGSWYAAGEARRHLDRKYEHALGQGLIRSAEDFIRDVAAGSSLSGEPYQVRCQGSQAVPSAVWLNKELMRLRNRSGAGK